MIFEKINELSIFSESVLLLVFSEVLFSTEMTCSATLIFFARKYIKVGTIKINKEPNKAPPIDTTKPTSLKN